METDLRFDLHGAQLFPGAVRDSIDALAQALSHLPAHRAGVRIASVEALSPFLTPDGPIGAIAAKILGPGLRAVRAIMFDKTDEMNWSLTWHQDRTICVKQRIDVAGFEPWTTKGGMQHVTPPFDLLMQMVTLRVHLDDVSAFNAPLLIAPGSHRLGRVPVNAVEDAVRRCGTHTCLATAGDVWLYATPILHASEAATRPARRRVLQIDFAVGDLPGGLEWLGV